MYSFSKIKPSNGVHINLDTNTIKVDISGAVVNPGVYEFEKGVTILDVLNDERIEIIMYADVYQIEEVGKKIEEDLELTIPYLKGYEPTTYIPCIDEMTIEDYTMNAIVSNTKAESIINFIKENGGLKSFNELLQISGIGERTIEKLVAKTRLC